MLAKKGGTTRKLDKWEGWSGMKHKRELSFYTFPNPPFFSITTHPRQKNLISINPSPPSPLL